MRIISKGETIEEEGVLLTLEEYNQVLLDKQILDEMEKLMETSK